MSVGSGHLNPVPWFRQWRFHCAPLTATVVLAAFGAVTPAGVACGQDQRLYAGIAGFASQLSASLDKRVDTRAPDTLVPEPRRGRLLHDQDDGSAVSYGPGFFAGYRQPIVGNALYLAAEVELALDSETVEGRLQGIGSSAGRNQLGESWPDQWSYKSDRTYGASVRLGIAAGPLRILGASLYALFGVRRVEGTFSTRFDGCLSPTPCSAAPDTPNFVSGTDSRALNFDGTVLGIGLERRFRQRVAVRLELRHTRYDDESWVTPFDDVAVTVPTAVGTKQTALIVSLARTF